MVITEEKEFPHPCSARSRSASQPLLRQGRVHPCSARVGQGVKLSRQVNEINLNKEEMAKFKIATEQDYFGIKKNIQIFGRIFTYTHPCSTLHHQRSNPRSARGAEQSAYLQGGGSAPRPNPILPHSCSSFATPVHPEDTGYRVVEGVARVWYRVEKNLFFARIKLGNKRDR